MYCRYYNANTDLILGIMIMNMVLNGLRTFSHLGLKQYGFALAICGVVGISNAEAATRNHNPPSLKAGAPHVYVVKKGIRFGIFLENF